MDAYNENKSELALRLMEACALSGDALACYMAALWRRNGEGAPVDAEQSEKWLTRLEELAYQGNITAQWELGQQYRFGDLLPLDVQRANYWLERAAESGCGAAQHHLGWFYETGQYEYPVDPKAAELWYQRAFAQEYPETLYLYAIRKFRDGRPTDEAISLLRKAAAMGFTQAVDLLRSYTH